MRVRPLLLFSLMALLLSACGTRQKVEYFPTGDIKYRAPLNAQGVIDGEAKCFYQNGAVKVVLPYRNGRIEGLIKRFYPTGQLENSEFCKNGETFGPVKHYYPTGQLKHASTRYGTVYRDTSRSYHPNGELDQMIIYDGKGRRIDFHFWRPDGNIDAGYARPFFLTDRDTVPEGQDYTFEAVLGARHSNVVNVKVLRPRTGVDSTKGTYSRTRYIVRRPMPGQHTVTVQLYNHWARKGSDTIWTNETIPISKSFWVKPNHGKK